MKYKQVLRVLIHRGEKGDALNVVPMEVRNEYMRKYGLAMGFPQQVLPKRAKPCTAIENVDGVT